MPVVRRVSGMGLGFAASSDPPHLARGGHPSGSVPPGGGLFLPKGSSPPGAPPPPGDIPRFSIDSALRAARRQHSEMNIQLHHDLQVDGYATRISRLYERGHSTRIIQSAVVEGKILRLCRDWIATTQASQASLIAIANYGKLTGSTSLAAHGIWDADDRRLHVAVRPNSHGSQRQLRVPIANFVAPRSAPTGFERHWSRTLHLDDDCPPWRTSVVDALAQVSRDSPEDQFVACVDSALNTGCLSIDGLDKLFVALPYELRYLRHWIDADSQSGLESLGRIRIRRFADRVETQVEIPGINPYGRSGRVDLLVDGFLVIEFDGDEFHDPVLDRERNAAVVRRGYRTHRFGHAQVLRGWTGVEATVRELLKSPPGRMPRRS